MRSQPQPFQLRSSAARTTIEGCATAYYHAPSPRPDRRPSDEWEVVSDDAEPIGVGSGRLVTRLDPALYRGGMFDSYVVKLAHEGPRPALDGVVQNEHETRFWRRTEHARLLPVVAASPSFRWVVMPYGGPVQGSPELDRWLETTRAMFDARLDATELVAVNTVRLGHEYRLCDFGWPALSTPDTPVPTPA